MIEYKNVHGQKQSRKRKKVVRNRATQKISIVVGKDLFGTDSVLQKSVSAPLLACPNSQNAPKINQVVERQTKYIQRFSIRPNYSVCFNVRADGLPPSRNGFANVKSNKAEGIIRKKAATKINNAMKWLILFSHKKRVYSRATKKSFWFKINFITLTLSEKQKHSDEYIKRHMLQPFVKWMARAHNAKLYLWKAEAQKNGNIHFHITTNAFIHWKSIRAKWNSIQRKNGYAKAFTAGNERNGVNSTDVHSVINEEQISNYMVKYILKNQSDRRLITGRLWACSPVLSNLKITFDEHDNEFYEAAELISRQSEYKKLDHASLFLHQGLHRMQLNSYLRGKIAEVYKNIAPKMNTQTYFTVE